MAYNLVEVTISVAAADGSSSLSGQMTFFPSDFVWDVTAQQVVVVEPISFGTGGGANTSAPVTANFLAMDNETLNTTWAWILTAGIPGLPTPIPMRRLEVNFANGAQQQLTDLLKASTIVPA